MSAIYWIKNAHLQGPKSECVQWGAQTEGRGSLWKAEILAAFAAQ
jgi:hypothetical protein